MRRFVGIVSNVRRTGGKFTLVFDHALGGGANRYRDHLVESVLAKGNGALLVSPILASKYISVEAIGAHDRPRLRAEGLGEIRSLAASLPIDQIVLNNVVSFEHTLDLVELATELRSSGRTTLTVNVHDYSPICPSWSLLDDTGRFCGVPDLDRCLTCLPANRWEFLQLVDPNDDIKSWRSTWKRCLDAADQIICFSASSVGLLLRAYPSLDRSKIDVRPHVVDYLPAVKPRIDLAPGLHIGVVGWLAYHKGTAILENLAAEIRQRELTIPITVFGTWDRPTTPQGIHVTRSFQPAELAGLIERSGANVFLFPSVVPETFSFVCEELMQLGVPLAVFDIGAPPERVAHYDRGVVLGSMEASDVLDALLGFHGRLLARASRS